jgi:SnoaL-like domain
MDAQGTMRLMFDTMDAYDRADFDRLAEIYAEDAQWLNADSRGPHCHSRDDIFAMSRERRNAGIRIGFDELRSTPTQVLLTARVNCSNPVVTVFSFQGRRIGAVGAMEGVLAGSAARQCPPCRWARRIAHRRQPRTRSAEAPLRSASTPQ